MLLNRVEPATFPSTENCKRLGRTLEYRTVVVSPTLPSKGGDRDDLTTARTPLQFTDKFIVFHMFSNFVPIVAPIVLYVVALVLVL